MQHRKRPAVPRHTSRTLGLRVHRPLRSPGALEENVDIVEQEADCPHARPEAGSAPAETKRCKRQTLRPGREANETQTARSAY